jgi:hypothetical protein
MSNNNKETNKCSDSDSDSDQPCCDLCREVLEERDEAENSVCSVCGLCLCLKCDQDTTAHHDQEDGRTLCYECCENEECTCGNDHGYMYN